MQNVRSCGEVPVYKLVLLQILAALSNISGHVEKVYHGQAGWLLLIEKRQRKSQNVSDYIEGRFGKVVEVAHICKEYMSAHLEIGWIQLGSWCVHVLELNEKNNSGSFRWQKMHYSIRMCT